MNKAREQKEEKKMNQANSFASGKNWKPQITQPIQPKLSAFLNKGYGSNKLRSLNRPVSPNNKEDAFKI